MAPLLRRQLGDCWISFLRRVVHPEVQINTTGSKSSRKKRLDLRGSQDVHSPITPLLDSFDHLVATLSISRILAEKLDVGFRGNFGDVRFRGFCIFLFHLVVMEKDLRSLHHAFPSASMIETLNEMKRKISVGTPTQSGLLDRVHNENDMTSSGIGIIDSSKNNPPPPFLYIR